MDCVRERERSGGDEGVLNCSFAKAARLRRRSVPAACPSTSSGRRYAASHRRRRPRTQAASRGSTRPSRWARRPRRTARWCGRRLGRACCTGGWSLFRCGGGREGEGREEGGRLEWEERGRLGVRCAGGCCVMLADCSAYRQSRQRGRRCGERGRSGMHRRAHYAGCSRRRAATRRDPRLGLCRVDVLHLHLLVPRDARVSLDFLL